MHPRPSLKNSLLSSFDSPPSGDLQSTRFVFSK
uniref:Uncharacterized protein n=1 Tax=Arundo donax TaxID=35708 RepID=A0A0A9ESL8_ARUDO